MSPYGCDTPESHAEASSERFAKVQMLEGRSLIRQLQAYWKILEVEWSTQEMFLSASIDTALVLAEEVLAAFVAWQDCSYSHYGAKMAHQVKL